MSGRGVGFLVVATIIAAARCGPSPAGPDLDSVDESETLKPAAHLDCDSAEDIRARIDALEEDGTLNSGRATALRNKLDQAERHEAAGRTEEAADAYARLIAQVEGWVGDGTLSEEEAEELLGCAEDVADGPDVSFAAISGGLFHTCGVTTAGKAYCWGDNRIGQLGDGNTGTDSDTPVAVSGGLSFESISEGQFYTCGVTAAGDAYCWGRNGFGELGDGNAGTDSDTPVAVSGGLSFQAISAGGFHSCGVTTAGDAYCWGENDNGQLGDGNAGTNSDTPVAVSGGLSFESISAGGSHTCALTTTGDTYCWGLNLDGQLGDGNAGTDSDTPVAVSGGFSFESISAGGIHTCAMTATGDAYCWGENSRGQLGDGNAPINSHTPIAVSGGLSFESISAGGFYTCGVTTSGNAYCWGENDNGQLGDGNVGTDSDSPLEVVSP